MTKKINFITSNLIKLAGAKQILEPEIEIVNIKIDIEEPQTPDIDYISKFKVKKGFEICKEPVIAQDGGFFIEKYQGFPGAYSRDIAHMLGAEGMARLIDEGDRGYWYSVISYKDSEREFSISEKLEGTFTKKPCSIEKDRSIIGRIFKPDSCNGKYMIEMLDDEEFDNISREYKKLKNELLSKIII